MNSLKNALVKDGFFLYCCYTSFGAFGKNYASEILRCARILTSQKRHLEVGNTCFISVEIKNEFMYKY